VEQLSGKPAELGPALTEGRGSWWAGGYGGLAPGWCLSQWDRAPVVPHRAEALQGLMDGSPRGRGLVVPRVAGAQQGLKGSGLGVGEQVFWRALELAPGWGLVWMGGGDPGGRGSGGVVEGQISWCVVGLGAGGQHGLRGRDSALRGSGARLWPGAACGVESLAEWSSSSADLPGWGFGRLAIFY
jgi:hypothetical protein